MYKWEFDPDTPPISSRLKRGDRGAETEFRLRKRMLEKHLLSKQLIASSFYPKGRIPQNMIDYVVRTVYYTARAYD
jgi:hypothetical protein